MSNVTEAINNPGLAPEERLAALRSRDTLRSGDAPRSGAGSFTGTGRTAADRTGEVNNHIHTIYSFSPYTPAMAALKAYEAGLAAAGSVDHDSAAAGAELKAACAELGIGGCSGFEMRVSFKKRPDGSASPLAARKINNPDSQGIAYITVQGIPSPALEKAAAFLKPVREARLVRSRKMTESANLLLSGAGLSPIDFENDVVKKSQYERGGEITERHILAAAAVKCIEKFGAGADIAGGLHRSLGIVIPEKPAKLLSDSSNPHYLYDLLGVLKTGLLPRIFIQPGEQECIPAKAAVDFALSIEAVPAYSYLGDVGESLTGDKKPEKFEDDYLPELFEEIHAAGFRAVTYMPPRNTAEQLERVRKFCAEGNYMEISGVDINSSRQSFNCPQVLRPGLRHLLDTTWALVAHEYFASSDPAWGLFSSKNPLAPLPLSRRIEIYSGAGKSLDLKHPGDSAPALIEQLRRGKAP
ncbi:MAG: PHP domain-containing protein [Treponema sp.]|jgi:hypothetical protein|nr:PHP domain-containing protein [Treponema sp.]